MKSVFVDLGAFTGDTIETAMRIFPNASRYIAFEPLPEHFRILKEKFGGNDRVLLVNAAASTRNGSATFHRGLSPGQSGGSLCVKTNCSESDAFSVETIDLARFLRDECPGIFDAVLKCDIEGMEYELLPHLIETGAIRTFGSVYCEWHYDRIAVPRDQHDGLVAQLNGLGFALTGENRLDEFAFYARDRESLGRVAYALGVGWPRTKLRAKARFPKIWGAIRFLRERLGTAS